MTTFLREYQALQFVQHLPLLPYLLRPATEPPKGFEVPPSKFNILKEQFNASQTEAIKVFSFYENFSLNFSQRLLVIEMDLFYCKDLQGQVKQRLSWGY